MPICKKCNAKFPNWLKIDGKKRNLRNRKYCLYCSPFGSRNTKKIHIKDKKINSDCICKLCGRKYKYIRGKGHTTKNCNSCVVAKSRGNLKERAIKYKGGKCEKCGYNRCIAALCFHHTDPTQKDFNIGNGYSFGWDIIKLEIDKCILVCQNCHHEIHNLPE